MFSSLSDHSSLTVSPTVSPCSATFPALSVSRASGVIFADSLTDAGAFRAEAAEVQAAVGRGGMKVSLENERITEGLGGERELFVCRWTLRVRPERETSRKGFPAVGVWWRVRGDSLQKGSCESSDDVTDGEEERAVVLQPHGAQLNQDENVLMEMIVNQVGAFTSRTSFKPGPT